MVDLCTGSGAVALSVATEVPGSSVHAVELDEQAVSWAARNLAGSGVDLRAGDMASSFPDLDGTVDVVVSNPPYIPLEAYESVTPEVRDHDPSLALWSGEDGLDAIRVVERVAARLLVPGGRRGRGARRGPGRGGARGVRGHRPLDRRARPRGPGRPGTFRDRAAGRAARRTGRHPGWQTDAVSTRYDTSDEAELEEGLSAAARAVQRGRLVLLPTDTVYGVGADAFSPEAVTRLLEAKGRGRQMPPPVLVSAKTTVEALAVDIPVWAKALIEELWPGPADPRVPPAAEPAVGPGGDPRHRRGPDARPRRDPGPAGPHRARWR